MDIISLESKYLLQFTLNTTGRNKDTRTLHAYQDAFQPWHKSCKLANKCMVNLFYSSSTRFVKLHYMEFIFTLWLWSRIRNHVLAECVSLETVKKYLEQTIFFHKQNYVVKENRFKLINKHENKATVEEQKPDSTKSGL